MSVCVLSPDALQDLQDIWDFIARDNENAADQLEDKFFNTFDKLAQRPGMGHTRADLTDRDVRFCPPVRIWSCTANAWKNCKS
jgi:plasmid stabilization system protein ParE